MGSNYIDLLIERIENLEIEVKDLEKKCEDLQAQINHTGIHMEDW